MVSSNLYYLAPRKAPHERKVFARCLGDFNDSFSPHYTILLVRQVDCLLAYLST
jgi:hypothetical protein